MLRGSTRWVLLLGPWAFKFGRGEYGALCNRYEAELYARSEPHRQAMLCPVLWCSHSGQLQIARRAKTPITQEQLENLKRDNQAFEQWGPGGDECPFEWKPTDWGILDELVVAVDYAAPVR